MTENVYSLPVMDSVKAAWDKVSGSKATLWKVLAILFLVTFVLGIFSGMFKNGMPALSNLLHFVAMIIQALIGWSLVYMGIQRALSLPIDFKMISYSFDFHIILHMILYAILRMLVLLPAGIVLFIGIALSTGMAESLNNMAHKIGPVLILISLPVIIYLSVRMWIGPAIILDKRQTAIEALKQSFKVTRGNVWNLIGIFIMVMIIFILCSITLGIGLIWGLPCVIILYGEVYKRLYASQSGLVS